MALYFPLHVFDADATEEAVLICVFFFSFFQRILQQVTDYVATNLRVLSGRTSWADLLEEELSAVEEWVFLDRVWIYFLFLLLCYPR